MNNSIFFPFNISFPLLPLTSVFKLLSTSLLQSFPPAILLTPLPIHLHIESCSAFLCFFPLTTLVTQMRESSWKWAFDAHPGFSVSSGLLFPKLPFVSWLQIWRFETEGRVWPWARSTPFCARPNPPFSIRVSPLFFFFYILPARSLYKRWWFSLFTHSCPPILCTRSSGDFASSFHE